jgi:UDP-glucose 4-epimerase
VVSRPGHPSDGQQPSKTSNVAAVRGRRVLISGMGGELGSLVASMVEQLPWAGRIVGLDLDPPRRRLRRAEFHLVHPTDGQRIERIVNELKPQVVIHLGVYEPDARASAAEAAVWTAAAATSVLDAAAKGNSLSSVVIRSGIEIYGRLPNGAPPPDESAALAPSSAFGRQLLDVESITAQATKPAVSVARLRLAPVIGPHVPSPLGRLLRLPTVPFNILGNPSFCVIDDHDAARAIVAAAEMQYDGTLNVVANGSIRVCDAARRGSKLPVPVLGPQWMFARPFTRLLGAPIPDHVQELLHHGRTADASRLRSELNVTPAWSTVDVIDSLHSWESVTYVRRATAAA